MLDGWLHAGLDPANARRDRAGTRRRKFRALAARGMRLNPHASALADVAAIVVAVKPQTADQAMPAIAPMAGASTVVVSIMAGRTLQFLSRSLKNAGAFVRAMPNTPAVDRPRHHGRGAAARQRNAARPRASPARRDRNGRMGRGRELMDAVTAVSGSGPAYVFLLAEALAQAGAAAGLPQALADQLARETVAGSGELLHRSALDAATLARNVTSPGGTTAAALEVLMDDNGLGQLMKKAVAAATERSRKLAG